MFESYSNTVLFFHYNAYFIFAQTNKRKYALRFKIVHLFVFAIINDCFLIIIY